MHQYVSVVVFVCVLFFVIPAAVTFSFSFLESDLAVSMQWEGENVADGGVIETKLGKTGTTSVEFFVPDATLPEVIMPGTEVFIDVYKGDFKDSSLYYSRSIIYGIVGSAGPSFQIQWDEPGNYFVAVYTKNGQTLNQQVEADLYGLMRPWFMDGVVDGGAPPSLDWGIHKFSVKSNKSLNSSVAFVPGFQATRLYEYEDDIISDELEKRWDPSLYTDIPRLNMNKDGESINDIRVGEPIDSILGYGSVYRAFMDMLDGLVQEGQIAEWRSMPYDWRRAQVAVVQEDIAYLDEGAYNMVERVEEMAADSDTGKVTLVGHSNGGLVGKLLVSELSKQGKDDLIDKLILVGTPQIGTPKSIPAVLNGEGQSRVGGWVVDRSDAVDLAKNMPGSYPLMPSPEYFRTVSSTPVRFGHDDIGVYTDEYGSEVDSYQDFDAFLHGAEGREGEGVDDLGKPVVANESVLTRMQSVQNTLDDWHAPESLEVFEIIGWGLETIASTKYTAEETFECDDSLFNFGGFECKRVIDFDYEPIVTREGDGTVVEPSAGYLDDAEDYYLRFKEINLENEKNYEHANMAGISELQGLMTQIIENESVKLNKFITDTKPDPKELPPSLRLSVHSPVDITVTNAVGQTVGLQQGSSSISSVREEIPNATYLSFGEGKYVYLPSDGEYDIALDGTGTSTFTFKVQRLSGGGEVTASTTFAGIPTTSSTKADVNLDGENLASTTISMDFDGDGSEDKQISVGETGFFSTLFNNSAVPYGIKKAVQMRLQNFKRDVQRNNLDKAWRRFGRVVDFAKRYIRKQSGKKSIPSGRSKKMKDKSDNTF